MKKTLLYTLAAVALASCSSDEIGENASALKEARITAGVSGAATRANGNTWESDEIGVIVTNAPNSNMEVDYKNMKYVTTSQTSGSADFTPATADQAIFFQDATETVTFAAYAPYQQTTAANTLPGDAGVISKTSSGVALSTESQSTRELQKAIDFIHAKGATASNSNPTVSFNATNNAAFAHKMTRLVLVMKTDAASGFSASDVTTGTYTLEGLTHEGTFNVLTGEAKATVPGSSAAGPWSLSTKSLKEETTDQITFTSILFPQDVASLTLKASIGGQTYQATLNPGLASGMSYTYTVTMKKQGLTVSGCTIEEWGSGNGATGEDISGKIPVTYNVNNLTSGSTVTISEGSTVILTGSSSSGAITRAANTTPVDLTVVITGSAKLILDNVALEGTNTRIVVEHGTANIVLKGENSITLILPAPKAITRTTTSDYSNCGPISLLNKDAHVIIDGQDMTNSLTITNGYDTPHIGAVEGVEAGNITIKNAKLKLNPPNTSDLYSSLIGTGGPLNSNVSCGDINILNSELNFNFSSEVAILKGSLIGNGTSYYQKSQCGDINISNSTLVSQCTSEENIQTYAALIGIGFVVYGRTSSCGKITITSSLSQDVFVSNLNNNGKIERFTRSGLSTPDWIGFGYVVYFDINNPNSASHKGIVYNNSQIAEPQTKKGEYLEES